jgi:hypothetical protein
VAYNDHGDQIEEVFEHEAREYGMDEQGRLSDSPTKESVTRSEARFRYDYDARGNWVEKVIEGRSGADQDFTVSSIERRTLAYYEVVAAPDRGVDHDSPPIAECGSPPE